MVHRGCAWVILWTTLVLPLLLLLSFYTDWWSGGETHGFTGAVLINRHKSLTAFHLHPTKLEVYTKLEGLHQTGGFTPNWMVYTKLEGLHQTGGFTQTWKLEGLHKIGGFTQTCSIYCGRQNYISYCIQPLLHKTRRFTQTCSSYCSSFK